MRVLSVLLVTAALAASSGCFGKDDGGETTNPTPTPTTGATPTSPTGATPTNPTANATPTTPPKPPAKQLCTVSKDFTQNTPAPGTPPPAITTGTCGAVTAGYTKISLTVNWTSAAPVGLQSDVSVRVMDAAGTAVLTCAAPAPGPATATTCAAAEVAAAVGDYTLEFHGTGNWNAAGSVDVA